MAANSKGDADTKKSPKVGSCSDSDSSNTSEEERLRRLFQTCDADGDGFIDGWDFGGFPWNLVNCKISNQRASLPVICTCIMVCNTRATFDRCFFNSDACLSEIWFWGDLKRKVWIEKLAFAFARGWGVGVTYISNVILQILSLMNFFIHYQLNALITQYTLVKKDYYY